MLASTNARGLARFDSLEPGTWEISASAEGHEPASIEPRDLRSAQTAKIDLKLVAGGRTLTGTITDASGGPISGARIDAAKLVARVLPRVKWTVTAEARAGKLRGTRQSPPTPTSPSMRSGSPS